MFDLRYHVASLTAVFLALVIGILVGVGLADRGLFDQAKKSLLERRVTQLQTQLDQARSALPSRPGAEGGAAVRERDLPRARPQPAAWQAHRRRLHRLGGRRCALPSRRRSPTPALSRFAYARLKMPIDASTRRREAREPDRRQQLHRQGEARDPREGARQASSSTAGIHRSGTRSRTTLVEEQFGGGEGAGRRRGRRADGAAAGSRDRRTVPPRALQGAAARRACRRSAWRRPTRPIRPSPSSDAPGSRASTTSTPPAAAWARAPARRRAAPASYGLKPAAKRVAPAVPASSRARVAEPLTILVAARDEEARIGTTVGALRAAFPDAEVIVADDGSRDGTAARGGARGRSRRPAAAPRQGPGADACRAGGAARGALLLCDADLEGDVAPAARQRRRSLDRRFRRAAGRRLRAREARRARARQRVRPASSRASRSRASARSRPRAREACFPTRPRLRLRGADDDRRGSRRAQRRGARSAAAPPRDRARCMGLRPPGAPAPGGGARMRAARASITAACACRSWGRSSRSADSEPRAAWP